MWKKKSCCAGLAVLLSGLLLAGLLPVGMPSASAETLAASVEHLPYAAHADRAADVRHQGALFRVTRDGKVSYLFGTIHIGNKGLYPLAPEVSRALAGADTLVVELDTRADDAYQQALDRHASYPVGDTIRNHISAATLADVTEVLHRNGIPLANVAQLKPWLLANLLMGMQLEHDGYVRGDGIESFLLASAQAHATPVAELESADYQLALFDTLGDADAERYLRESLAAIADGSALKQAQAVIAAWTSGDHVALDALVAQATAGGSVRSEFTRRTLLGRRNPEMAAHIERIMHGNKVTFVGVGLLHLLGANGLPQLLAQRGYQVERVY